MLVSSSRAVSPCELAARKEYLSRGPRKGLRQDTPAQRAIPPSGSACWFPHRISTVQRDERARPSSRAAMLRLAVDHRAANTVPLGSLSTPAVMAGNLLRRRDFARRPKTRYHLAGGRGPAAKPHRRMNSAAVGTYPGDHEKVCARTPRSAMPTDTHDWTPLPRGSNTWILRTLCSSPMPCIC